MITVLILVVILFVVGVELCFRDNFELGGALVSLTVLPLLIIFPMSTKWAFSEKQLTGYVYQRSERFGYVSYDLRFSQNAGADNQPSFCVAANSDEDKKIAPHVGANVKVTINVPKNGFRFVNNPFTCDSFATLKGVINEPAS